MGLGEPVADRLTPDEIAQLERRTYDVRALQCFRDGHQPVRWETVGRKFALCSHCGRTWPLALMRLLTMAGIQPEQT